MTFVLSEKHMVFECHETKLTLTFKKVLVFIVISKLTLEDSYPYVYLVSLFCCVTSW